MSSEPPPGSGRQPPEDDPFRKQPLPPGGGQPPPYPGSGGPYGGEGPGGGGSHEAGGPYGAGGPPGGGHGSGDPYGGAGPGPYGAGSGPYGGGPYGGGPYGGAGQPGDPLAGMPPLADSGRRTLARIIDMILVGLVVWLLTLAFGVNEYSTDGDEIEVGKSLGQSLVAAVLYIAYDTLMTAKNGQTLGKKLMKMRVADLSDGSTPSVRSALVRAAVLWIPFAFCCACIWTAVSGGWSFFDKPYKQGLHDKAAKTVVVSTG